MVAKTSSKTKGIITKKSNAIEIDISNNRFKTR
jgi:hypothetical protein